MSGRLNELAESFLEADLQAEAARLRPLQRHLDTIQRPTRLKNERKALKAREQEVFTALEHLSADLIRGDVAWAAREIERLLGILRFEAEMRDEAWMGRELLAEWDKNENGLWEPSEVHAYRQQVEAMRRLSNTDAFIPRWFFMAEDAVYGPWPLSRITGGRELPPYLVRYGRTTGWVRLSDLID